MPGRRLYIIVLKKLDLLFETLGILDYYDILGNFDLLGKLDIFEICDQLLQLLGPGLRPSQY